MTADPHDASRSADPPWLRPRTIVALAFLVGVTGAVAIGLLRYGGSDGGKLLAQLVGFLTIGGGLTGIAAKLHGVSRSVGTTDGATLAEMMAKVVELDEYTHARNHDMLNELHRVNAQVQLLMLSAPAHSPARRAGDALLSRGGDTDGTDPPPARRSAAQPQEGPRRDPA